MARLRFTNRFRVCDKVTLPVEIFSANGEPCLNCLCQLRGQAQKARVWLRTAAAVPGFVGFAAGRTSLWNAIMAWLYANLTTEETTALIARRYREFVDSFEEKRRTAA